MKTTSRFSLVLATGALLLAGCAVMTVDVDVYKGPLANHEEVQIEQLRVMANSAKPLIVLARNRLDRTFKTNGFVPMPAGGGVRGKTWFTNANAEQLNMVLSLYEDRIPRAEAELLNGIKRAIEVYREADLRLNVTNLSPELSSAFKKAIEFSSSSADKEAPAARMLPGIQTFLTQPYKDPDLILSNLSPSEFQARLSAAFAAAGGKDLKGAQTNFGDTAKLRWLENEEFRNRIVRSALPAGATNAVLERELRQALEEMPLAFRQARTALAEIFESSLRLVAETSRNSASVEDASQRMENAAEFASDLVNLERLRNLFRSTTFRPGDGRLENLLRRSLESFAPEAARGWPNVRDVQLKRAVQVALRDEPEKAAEYLIDAHRQLIAKSSDLVENFQMALQAAEPPESRLRNGSGLYGLPKGPAFQRLGASPDESAKSPAELLALASRLSGAGGYERGRGNLGLDSLVETHLDAARAQNKPAAEKAAEELMRELVYFSQKVLFLANNIILIENNPAVKQQIRVLQAVGNSILTQVDEYHHRRTHGDRQTTNTGYHVESYQKARIQDGAAVLNGLVGAAEKEARERAEKAKSDAEAVATRAEQALKAAERAEAAAQEALTRKKDVEIAQRIRRESHWTAIAALFDAAKAVAPAMTTEQAEVKKIRQGLAARLTGAASASELEQVDLVEAKLLPVATAASEARDDVFARVAGRIQTEQHALQDEVIVLRRAQSDLERALEAAAKAKTSAAKDHEAKTKAVAAAVESASLEASATAELSAHRYKILPQLASLGDQQLPNAPIVLLIRSMEEALAALKKIDESQKTEGQKNQEKALAPALQRARSWPRPDDGPVLASAPLAEKGADVWSVLITELQFQQAEAIRNGQAATAAAIENALRAAREHRSGLAYIRPASSFLRNSYSVSSLQNNRVGWKNTLSQHARRSLPLASGFPENNPDRKTQDAIREIDNQFWQNINRVRVAGGGNSNYVLAKDDVGNWYIKEYSVNVEQIVNSMQKLAVFGAGPALGASGAFNLAAGSNNGTAPPKSAYRAQYDLFTTNYLNGFKALYLDLKTSMTPAAVNGRVMAAWNQTTDATLTGALKSATNSLVELPAFSNDVKASDEQLLKLARGLAACFRSLTNSPAANQSGMMSAAKKTLGDDFKSIADRREALASEYETALKVIGTTVGN